MTLLLAPICLSADMRDSQAVSIHAVMLLAGTIHAV